MNISTDHLDENPFPNKPSGGYEWWYFDALSEDRNWFFVIIFYQGNPFSPEYIRSIKKILQIRINFQQSVSPSITEIKQSSTALWNIQLMILTGIQSQTRVR